MNELKSIKGVEIFSAGTWNGDEYTTEHIDEMILAFTEVKGVRPYLKLGHDDDQKLLQKDGMPAAGWVGRLYRKGEKLLADFIDIPQKIYQLIENKAYRKVSSEIYFNVDLNGKKYPKLLGGVALLGADTPGVMNLADILGMYGLTNYETLKKYSGDETQTKVYDFINKESKMEKTALEVKLEQELAEQKVQFTKTQDEIKKIQDEKAELEKQANEYKEFKAKTEKEDMDRKLQAKKDALKLFITELKADKKCTPAMEPLVELLLGEEKQEYTIKSEKDEKKVSKQELFKEVLKLAFAASDVNLEERSEEGDDKSKKDDEETQVEKIEKYAAEKKISFKQARRELGIEIKKAAVL